MPLGVSSYLTVQSRKPIQKIQNLPEKVARVQVSPDSADTVRIDPLASGEARIVLTDSEGTEEACLVRVCKADLMLTAGERKSVQMSTRRPIKVAVSQYPRIVRVQRDKDAPQSIVFVAESVGASSVVLFDDQGKQEAFQVGVKPAKKQE